MLKQLEYALILWNIIHAGLAMLDVMSNVSMSQFEACEVESFCQWVMLGLQKVADCVSWIAKSSVVTTAMVAEHNITYSFNTSCQTQPYKIKLMASC